MSRTALPQLLPTIPTLAGPDLPFSYEVDGDCVLGRWDIVKATSLFPDQVRHLDKRYRLQVSFDADKGTYDFVDQSTEVEASAGRGGAKASGSFFRGKEIRKSWSWEPGVHQTEDGVSGVLAYRFDTGEIKKPLFAHLEQHGWKPKSFLTRMFSR